MLTLFENITHELTDLEKSVIVPKIIEIVNSATKEHPVTEKRMTDYFNRSGKKTSGIRIRKAISYIRQYNLTAPKVLIGGGNGYYTSNDRFIIDKQLDSLRQRVIKINHVIAAIEAQRNNL